MNRFAPRLFERLRQIIMVLVVLLLVGALYQAFASARDRRAIIPPGEMVEVNGAMMHLVCKGSGSPTVILEAGLDGSWIDWTFVHGDLAQQTRTCAYDRLGSGWSDLAPEPQSSDQVAATLNQLLTTADIAPPYILVGYSVGGVRVRSFYEQFPDKVNGMVLVDSSHEQQRLRYPEWVAEENAAFITQLQFCRVVAPFGLLRLVGFANGLVEEFDVSEEIATQFVAMFNQTQTCTGSVREHRAVDRDLQQSEGPHSLGDLPLVVLTRGVGEAEELAGEVPESFISDLEELDAMWDEMQLELVALSTNSMHLIAEESGHIIQATQPELVVDAVKMLLAD